jgi:hypothetical protein
MATVIAPGTSVTFPVEHTSPLASVQSVRQPTEADITAHPVLSGVLNSRVSEAMAVHPVAARTPALQATVTTNVVNTIIGNIGSIYKYNLDDITVTAGQTLTFKSSWSEVVAGAVKIASGGVIRVSVANPALPAFFLLTCTSLGSD